MTSNGAGNLHRTCSESGTADSHPGGRLFPWYSEISVSAGAGFRFAKIGIPWPGVMAPFVGTIEIICGGPVLIGLTRRLAVIPLFGVIKPWLGMVYRPWRKAAFAARRKSSAKYWRYEIKLPGLGESQPEPCCVPE